MAVLNMRYDGDEILRKKCKEVKEVDDRIREILNDMTDTLHATPNGAAIAANQVGILKRLVVIDMGTGLMTVSYTHLDVYKRQDHDSENYKNTD